MSEIDWSKAPEGAQYYCPDNRLFYKFDGAGRGMCTNPRGSWFPCGDINDCEDGELTPRSSPPAWSGEGLPPVGTVCEVRLPNKPEWKRVTIKLYDEGLCVFRDERSLSVEMFHHMAFRPIRTPEQIAAEEREKAVDALCYEIIMHYGYPKNAEQYRSLASKLHDAGYRKVEP